MAQMAKALKKDLENLTVSSPTCTSLLCCPFCGSDVKLLGGIYSQESISIWCKGRGCMANISYGYDKDEAIRKWNKRAT